MSIARPCPYDEEKAECKYEKRWFHPRLDKCPTCSRAKNVMMNIKLIKTESDYLSALKRIDELFDSEPNTPEGDELELLVTFVELYEKNNFPIESPTQIEGD